MAATSSAVGTAYAINIGIAFIVFFVFSWLRLRAWARRFYAPKRFDTTVDIKPRRLPPGYFGWMRVIFTYPENEVTEVAGLDSVVYLRVLRFGWETLVKIALVTCVILLPINITSDAVSVLLESQTQPPAPPPPSPPAGCSAASEEDVQAKTYSFTNFDRLSLTNVPAGDPKLWAYVVTVYIVTAIVLQGLHRYNKEATLLRLAFLANAPRGGPSHTTLITDIPGMRYGTIIWYLRSLVGSTLFVMLPKSLRQKVLDSVESGLDKAGNGLNILKLPHLQANFDRDSIPTGDSKSNVRDAYVKAAEYNSAIADAAEAARKKKATGVLTNRKRNKENMIQATDENLDPWKQAGDVLGDMNQPDANKVKGFIHDEMEMTYGKGCVAAVNPVWDQDDLDPLIEEYHNLRQKLEDYVDDLSSKLKRRKHIKKKQTVTVIPALLGSWGIERYGLQPIKVDAITYWSERLKFLVDEAIPAAQKECLTKAIPTAFVTVQTRHTQMIMTGALHHHDENTWQMQGAPEPKEIIWGNLPMRRWERGVRTIVLWAGYFLLLFFFMIPIAAVQALIEVPKLAAVPVLGDIVNLPFIKQILEAILPGLILLIFLALLPTILAWMCRLSGMVSTSQVDFGVVTRYFYFQVCSVVVGSIIAGSLFSQLKQFIAQPTSIIQILGVAIPMTATFFINYMLTAGVARMAIQHLRIPGLVIFWLLSKVAATPRARARLWSDQYTLYGPTVAYHMIAFLLGLTYSCINPVMGPTAVIYFSVAIISERYNNLYVFKRAYESGGRLWIYVFNQFIFCLYFMQIIMIILLSIKKFPFVPLLVPLPFITFAFHVFALSDFRRPWTIMSAHDAAQLDINDAGLDFLCVQRDRNGEALTPADLQQIQDMYLSPAFKVKPEDMVDLLREAEIVRRRVDGEKLEDIEAAVDEQTFVDAVDELEHDDDTTPKPTSNSTGNLDTSSVKVAITEMAEGPGGASYSGASTSKPAGALSVTKPRGPSSVASAPDAGVAGSHASTTATPMARLMSTQGSGASMPLLTPKHK